MTKKYSKEELKQATYNLYLRDEVASFLNKCNFDSKDEISENEFIRGVKGALNELPRNTKLYNHDFYRLIRNILMLNFNIINISKNELELNILEKELRQIFQDYKKDLILNKEEFIIELFQLLKQNKIYAFDCKYNNYNEITICVSITPTKHFSCSTVYELKNVIKHVEYFQ